MTIMILFTFCVSLAALEFIRRNAVKFGLLDVPNVRSSHSSPTPRGGGVAMAIAFTAAIGALYFARRIDGRLASALIGGGGVIAFIGFLDDRRHLSARIRFAVHLAAAMLVVMLVGGLPSAVWDESGIRASWIGWGLTVLVFACCTNAFNFMDGIDGIAGSEAAFVSLAGAFLLRVNGADPSLVLVMLCLAASALGFLVLNWPPARIFMGDAGSGFLGFTLTALALLSSQRGNVSVAVWPILGGVFLVDSTFTLMRRILRGDRWFEPHRMHAYQHLARRLGSHKQVTSAVIATNLCWLLPWAYHADRFPEHAGISILGALLPLTVIAMFMGAGKRES